ncbi:hypothetical protein CO652_26200 [Rhizobium sp. H4]|uniref:hypothetical protein n=1 Tax=Rhizobium sp. H4 TaxID=2035449 RepID=UPI000BE9A5CF|nr:hypothetical protein [Rhizobium sp. H4]PDV85542.1 hypothetical protein CO652_26200 [Rhizobium sp. H4]
MSEVRKGGPFASGAGYENEKPPWRMMIFVVTIFLVACLAGLAFMLATHSGEPDEKSPGPMTERAR